jgi:hypothetical protein
MAIKTSHDPGLLTGSARLARVPAGAVLMKKPGQGRPARQAATAVHQRRLHGLGPEVRFGHCPVAS